MRLSFIAFGVAAAATVLRRSASAADLDRVVQDGKFVRVDGRATFPEPAPPDSLVLLDASQSPPVVKATLEGLEHTVQGPPQAVAITPDGKLAVVAAPTRYDYTGKKEIFDNFLQVVDLEASPPKLIDKVDVAGHPNGLTINREGTLLLAAAHDGTVKVLSIEGKTLRLLDQVKVAAKRLSGISFTHDGKAAIVAQRDDNGAAVLAVEGNKVTLTNERITTGVTPYSVDISGDGKWPRRKSVPTASPACLGCRVAPRETRTSSRSSMFRSVRSARRSRYRCRPFPKGSRCRRTGATSW